MKDLQVYFDLKTETWNIGEIDDYNNNTEIIFGVPQRDPAVPYNGLKFGFVLSKDGQQIHSVSEPPEGITYISSDQAYLKSIPIKVDINTTYDLLLWVEESGKRYELDYTMIVPKPTQPFPSWTWDGYGWMPPVPMPLGTNNINLIWDETTLNWIQNPDGNIWNPSTGQWEMLPDYDVE